MKSGIVYETYIGFELYFIRFHKWNYVVYRDMEDFGSEPMFCGQLEECMEWLEQRKEFCLSF